MKDDRTDSLAEAVWQRDASRAAHNALPELLEALIWISDNGDPASRDCALAALKKAATVPKPYSGMAPTTQRKKRNV